MSCNTKMPFEIWLVQSDPSIGREFYGKRPALVIQSNFLTKQDGLCTVMLMSSFKGKKWKHDILVETSVQNRLWKPTLIKVQHIQSFDTSRFITKIGVLEIEWITQVQAYIKNHFGL